MKTSFVNYIGSGIGSGGGSGWQYNCDKTTLLHNLKKVNNILIFNQ